MPGVAEGRLAQERKNWRKDHPFGFVAKPETRPDGSVDMFVWKCLIPGKPGTDWAEGQYPLTIEFGEDYPTKPPLCYMPEGFFHPNVFDNGDICLSILNDSGGWRPSISVKQIVEGVQRLLLEPNHDDPAHPYATEMFENEKDKYRQSPHEERKNWRKDHPFGFVAKPETRPDGSVNMFVWKCLIPGKQGTDWEGGIYPLTLTFSEDYPTKPPLCYMPKGFFHPNVYESGKVCLSIINECGGWKPSISVKQIAEGVQRLLLEPNNDDPAQSFAYQIYKSEKTRYRQLVRQQARKYSKTS